MKPTMISTTDLFAERAAKPAMVPVSVTTRWKYVDEKGHILQTFDERPPEQPGVTVSEYEERCYDPGHECWNERSVQMVPDPGDCYRGGGTVDLREGGVRPSAGMRSGGPARDRDRERREWLDEVAPEFKGTVRRVELGEDDVPQFRLRIAEPAWLQLQEIVAETKWAFATQDIETGGWAFVEPAIREDEIVMFTGPGSGSKHSATSVRLMRSERVEVERSRPYLTCIGSWHVHPVEGSLRPSATDMSESARWCLTERADSKIDVIVAPVWGGGCRATAWITHNPGNMGWVTEPVGLNERELWG